MVTHQRGCECVGIDLGTTYSSIAYLDSQLTPRVVCDSSGQSVVPSVVFFDEQEIIVGEMALSHAKLRADRVVQFIKIYMGESWRKEFNGTIHTPESISALIIGQLLRESEPEIGEIPSAVITVPAYFSEKRRSATQIAGEIAGLRVIGTLNEPMSAALAYGLHRVEKEQFAVVYDLGGGTFDVTVVRITPNEIHEIATDGNRELGGRDWDKAMINHCCDQFRKRFGNDPRDDLQALQDLQIECERAKRRLGRMAKTGLRLHAFGQDFILDVSRNDFETMTAHLVQATRLTTEVALEDAGLDWSQITRTLLVGGSTHMPAVRQMLHRVSGKPPDTGVNPVAAVALGAAIYGRLLETGEKLKTSRKVEMVVPTDQVKAPIPISVDSVKPNGFQTPSPTDQIPSVHFVTAHGVGVIAFREGARGNRVLIPKNTRVPTEITRRFVTKLTGQQKSGGTLKIEITQGDNQDLGLVEQLGTGAIVVPANEPGGQPVDVTLRFDEQGRLHTQAVYVNTGKDMKMSIEVSNGLKQEQIKQFRNLLEQSGFVRPFDVDDAISNLSHDDDIPTIDPV